jgi:hypothetical protein
VTGLAHRFRILQHPSSAWACVLAVFDIGS